MSLVLLDRDGVINEDSPNYICSPSDWLPIPGSLHAIARLSRAGRTVAVCSNQSAVARGLISEAELAEIDRAMRSAIEFEGGRLQGTYYCVHGPEKNCACRKPAPGLLQLAMTTLNARPDETVYIGDSIRDIQAGKAAGCSTILVRTGNGRRDEPAARTLGVDDVADDLAAAVDRILQ